MMVIFCICAKVYFNFEPRGCIWTKNSLFLLPLVFCGALR